MAGLNRPDVNSDNERMMDDDAQPKGSENEDVSLE